MNNEASCITCVEYAKRIKELEIQLETYKEFFKVKQQQRDAVKSILVAVLNRNYSIEDGLKKIIEILNRGVI